MKAFLIVLLFNHLQSFSQVDSLDRTLFNNDSIRYMVVRVAEKINSSSPAKITMRYIDIEIPRHLRKYLLTLKMDFWLQRLSNENSDWATNLVLYNLYKRDAILLAVVYTNRNKWLKGKNEDVEYWKGFLSRRHGPLRQYTTRKGYISGNSGQNSPIDSIGDFKFSKNLPIRILTATKQSDTNSVHFSLDSATCKNWYLSKKDILQIFKFCKQISGTEWDLSYEVLPCSYEGEFIAGGKKGRYEINAASFVILVFRDKTIYLGCNLGDRYFLSHPQN